MFASVARLVRRLQGVHGDSFISFRPWLTLLCRHVRPRRVLEFGPGWSTRIMLKHTDSQIVSIEESPKWYQKYRREFDPTRVDLHYKPPGWSLDELQTLGPPFDVIFVDGGRRAQQLAFGAKLLSERGVACLHDAHREEYEPGIRAYAHVYFVERHGCILTNNADVMAEIRTVIAPDWSCRCKYCGTPARRAYLARFAAEAT